MNTKFKITTFVWQFSHSQTSRLVYRLLFYIHFSFLLILKLESFNFYIFYFLCNVKRRYGMFEWLYRLLNGNYTLSLSFSSFNVFKKFPFFLFFVQKEKRVKSFKVELRLEERVYIFCVHEKVCTLVYICCRRFKNIYL